MTLDHLALLGFGPRGWGWLLLSAVFMTLAVTLAAVAIGAGIGAVVAGRETVGARAAGHCSA